MNIKPLSVNQCIFCKNNFTTTPCHKEKKYCNVRCMTLDYRKTQIFIKCKVCKKDKSRPLSQSHYKFCSLNCYHISTKGNKRPSQSAFMKGKNFREGVHLTKEQREKVSGPNSPRWRGGITTLYHKIRRLPEYNQWRKNVFTRDDFKCVKCYSYKVRLEADHIKPFFFIIKEKNILDYEQALDCTELWDINNGRTLCRECHRKTETYGKNDYAHKTIKYK